MASDNNKVRPISRLDDPDATSFKTSNSRGVSEVRGVRTRVMSRLATVGDRVESPSAAERTAAKSSSGGASLSR